MLRRLFCTALTGGLMLALAACSEDGAKPVGNGSAANGEEDPAAATREIGAPLYAPAPEQSGARQAAAVRRKLTDPIVVDDCRLTVYDKQEVPAQKDGVIEFIGTEIKDSELPGVPRDRLIKVFEGKGEKRKEKYYKELREGDVVVEGQLMARLDDRLARDDLDIKEAKVSVAVADQTAAEKTQDEAYNRWKTQEKLFGSGTRGATSQEDLRGAKLVYETKHYEFKSKIEGYKQALLERDQARTTLELHEIRAKIPGQIKTIYKKRGESVRNLEPVFQILNLNKMRVEGLMDRQYLTRLDDAQKRGKMRVVVEASPPVAPVRVLKGHGQEVTSVAVGKSKSGQPFIVSTSEDRTLRGWSPELEKEQLIVRLPDGAVPRAVACSAAGAATTRVVCGASDGYVRVWDLRSKDDRTERKLEPAHQGSVTCVTVSPDGRFAASGGEDRQIIVWDLEKDKSEKLYAIPNAHTGIITTLQFTPRTQLLSAGRDNYLRVWTLGTQNARREMSQHNRSGEVPQLSASPDGRRVLFDYAKELQVLSVPDGQNEGYLQRPSKAAGFAGFALFSPDGELILTSGGLEKPTVQVWRAPGSNDRRGYEVRQLVTSPASPATCAAFSPDGAFVVTGHRNKDLCVWKCPSPAELNEEVKAELTLVDKTAESSQGQVRVWAHILKEGLTPNTVACMVIDPGE
jgi:WD40 repeat protein